MTRVRPIWVILALAFAGVGGADAAPFRSSDFTEQDRILAEGGQLDTETEIAGSDLLPPWYFRSAGGPCFVVTRKNPFPDPSLAVIQLVLDMGTTQPRHFDVHVAVWSTNAGASAALVEPRLNFPLGLARGALQPYAGASLISERVRRVELDHDAIAWLGMTYVTPDLYPLVAGRNVGLRDRFQVRLRLSLQVDEPTDPAPDRGLAAFRPHVHVAFPGALGWNGFSGFIVAHDRVRVRVGRPWEHTTYASIFYGPLDWEFHPFIRARWVRAAEHSVRDLSVGATLRLWSN